MRLGGGECQLAVVVELGAHAAGASASSKRWAICSSLRPGSSTTERTFWPPPIEMASTSRPPLRRLARFMPRTVKAVVVPLLLNFSCASSVPPEAAAVAPAVAELAHARFQRAVERWRLARRR
jgi:hypothetical protein